MEDGIIDKFCESCLEAFMKKAVDSQTNDSILSMGNVDTGKEHSYKQ
jgi:hypothetical protein